MRGCLYTALGDSITNGFMAYMSTGFSFRLNHYLKRQYGSSNFYNFGVPGLKSDGLLRQLNGQKNVRHFVKCSDLITISIGGNNLLKCTHDNYCRIDKIKAEKGADNFIKDWPAILYSLRDELASDADIFVMTLYNPYSIKDKNYAVADHYIQLVNNCICDEALKKKYEYCSVDVYSSFKNLCASKLTYFNLAIRDPHPNYEGHHVIAKDFIRCIGAN